MEVFQRAAVPLNARLCYWCAFSGQCRKMREISAGYLSGEQYKFGLSHCCTVRAQKRPFPEVSNWDRSDASVCQQRTRGRPAILCLVIQGSRQFCQSYWGTLLSHLLVPRHGETHWLSQHTFEWYKRSSCSASVSLSSWMNCRWFSALAHIKLTSLTTTLTTFSSFNTLLHKASWCMMQWRNISSSEFGVSAFTLSCNLFSSPMFLPVRFGDPSVVTLVSFLHGRLFFSRQTDTLSYKSTGLVVPIIDSIPRSSSVISKILFIPLTKIKSWAVSLMSVLSSSAIKKTEVVRFFF